jgi:hypothetical protein
VHSPKFCKFHSRLNMPCTQKSEHFQGLGKKADLDSPPHQSSPHHEWQCMTTIGPEFFFLSMHEIFPTFQTHVNLGPNTGPPLNPLRVGRHVNMVGSDAFEGRSSTQMRHLFNPDDEHTPQLTHSNAAAESINRSPFPSLSRSLVEYHQFDDGSKPTSNCCSCYTA